MYFFLFLISLSQYFFYLKCIVLLKLYNNYVMDYVNNYVTLTVIALDLNVL